tara:strand:+ start:172 stop:681 length:510 start_codon:yes stop_codon:yes gene_type:complete
MKKISLLLYYLFFKNLPSSYFPLGKIFNFLRLLCLRVILPVGKKTKVQTNVYIGNGSNIQIGDYCQINENVKLNNVSIGDYVMIAPGVTILGKSHKFEDINTPMVFQGEAFSSKTVIGDDVWIGTNAVIMPGVKINNGVIIGAGAIVTKSCDVFGVYGGVPASLIKKRI